MGQHLAPELRHTLSSHLTDDPLLDLAGPLRGAYAAADWAASPVGLPQTWPPVLRQTLAMAFETRFPVALFWGPEFVMIYNEGYVGQIIDKHPAALGRPAHEVFPEAWDQIEPLMRQVVEDDEPVWTEDAFFPLQRHGFLEETFFTFSYSALRDEEQRVVGVIDIAIETSSRVQAGRRLELLGRLGERLAGAPGLRETVQVAREVLGTGAADLPVAEIRIGGVPGPRSSGVIPDRPPRLPEPGELLLQDLPTGRVAWLLLGVATPDGQPLLGVRLNDMLAADEPYLTFLRLVASTIGQAIDRARIGDAQRRISETLQRSLLTEPPAVPGLEIAARYVAAAEQAQIGGDWYDAFVLPGGAVAMVIGDIAGHDGHAAATMAQVRGLLRGIAMSTGDDPATVLAALDRAMQDLQLGTFATCILAVADPSPDGQRRRVRWANAGHPPPLVTGRAGARLLTSPPELLLGMADRRRTTHETDLAVGETLLLYTDGLVERRGVPIGTSLEWLLEEAGRAPARAEDLCGRLLSALGDGVEDDVAMLAATAGDLSG